MIAETKNFNLREVLLLKSFKFGSHKHARVMNAMSHWLQNSYFHGFIFQDWSVRPWKFENDYS